jgi:outer membrane protein assembly factor BamA
MTVTFDVEEAAWTVPVVFDNFVTIPDEQLIAAVRREVPSFDGTAPVNAGAADFLARALQGVLKARSVPGRVELTAQADLKRPGAVTYVFAVKDPSPKICALHAAGASAIPEKELLQPLASIAGGEYSRLFVTTASNGTLRDMYRRRGHWRAAFAAPSVAVDECDGVSVTLNVTEGPSFAWDRAEWSGNAALADEALTRALAMKAGDTADMTRIDAGLRQVRDAYGKQGYIVADLAYEPRLDDASRKAVFQFNVQEGPQFRMGRLEFAGIRESDAEMLARRFRLKQGDVFDASYVREFQSKELLPLKTTSGARASVQMNVDRATSLVHLQIVFK